MSTQGGVSNSVSSAYKIGLNSFALFLKSPRRWVSPQYTPAEIEKFKANCKEYGYDPLRYILPHGLYFINLANPDREKADKSYDAFLDDLRRCESLGVGLYNLHPGSSLKGDHGKQLEQLAEYLNRAIDETEFVTILLENMAGTGNLVGSNLQDLRTVIDLIKNKNRIGVCVDTCHTFAAGYDISSKEALDKFWNEFDNVIGLKYLKAIHLNDSKAPLGANRDYHEKVGQGYLGLKFFKLLMSYDFLKGIPLILETPCKEDEEYGEEVKLLEWLESEVTNPETDEKFLEKYESLQKLGEPSRTKEMKKYEAKQKKSTGRKRKVESSDEDDDKKSTEKRAKT